MCGRLAVPQSSPKGITFKVMGETSNHACKISLINFGQSLRRQSSRINGGKPPYHSANGQSGLSADTRALALRSYGLVVNVHNSAGDRSSWIISTI